MISSRTIPSESTKSIEPQFKTTLSHFSGLFDDQNKRIETIVHQFSSFRFQQDETSRTFDNTKISMEHIQQRVNNIEQALFKIQSPSSNDNLATDFNSLKRVFSK